MATAIPPTVVPKNRARHWYLIIGFFLLVLATPIAYYLIAGWARDRQLAELYRELDEDDPHWRWPDLVKQYQPPPDDQNSFAHILKVQALAHEGVLARTQMGQRVAQSARLSQRPAIGRERATPATAVDKLNPLVMSEAH